MLPCSLQTLARRGLGTSPAPYVDLTFTDEEVITLYLFAVAMENKRQIKDIHAHARRYWRDWFSRLPGTGPMSNA
jgi:ADP-ribosylglycohydrolase